MVRIVVKLSVDQLRVVCEQLVRERRAFLHTEASPDIGEVVELELTVGRAVMPLTANVEGVESDAEGVPGLQVGLSWADVEKVVSFARSHGVEPATAELEEEPGTEPGTEPVGIPTAPGSAVQAPAMTAPPGTVDDVSVRPSGSQSRSPAQPSLQTPQPRLDAARAQPVSPAQPSMQTPQPSGPRLDAASAQPVPPTQPSMQTPQPSAPRLDAARAQPVSPAQPSMQTPQPRLDAARAQPVSPAQPSTQTPQPSAPRLAAARAQPVSPAQPSMQTPQPRLDAARAQPVSPAQPSTQTPHPSGPRLDAARAQPVSPAQPSTQTPQPSAPRLDAARAQPVSPAQPSMQTPQPRLDAARAQPVSPAQPSTQTPQPSAPRLDAARAQPASPAQPSLRTPPPGTPSSRPSGLTPGPIVPGLTGVQPAFIPPAAPSAPVPAPRPTLEQSAWTDRFGEAFGALGVVINTSLITRSAVLRAGLPVVMPAAWVLGVEWVRAPEPESKSLLVNLVVETVLQFGGALDQLDATGARAVFFGLGAQGASALAAQELKERIEALSDGASDAPSLKIGLVASRLRAEPEQPLEGEGLSSLRGLLLRAQPGQALLPRNVANGVVDLVANAPASEDDVQLVFRKTPITKPLPTVALEPLLKLLEARVAGVLRGPVAPVCVAGPRHSGRTHLAAELARRLSAAPVLVASASAHDAAGLRHGLFVDLFCRLCELPLEERGTGLAPALDERGVAPERKEALLAALGLSPTPTPFTAPQVADAVRLVLAEFAQRRPRVLLLDGLDQVDEGSLEVVRLLLSHPAPGELVVAFSTAEQGTALGLDVLPLPLLSAADVEVLLTAALGAAPAELRDALASKARGAAGLVVELFLLTVARGAVRPRGEALILEGVVPEPAERLALDRVTAEGARVRRLLEAVSLLGPLADAPRLAQVLPGVAQESWPRAMASKLLRVEQGRVTLSSTARSVSRPPLSGPGLAARCAALTAGQTRTVAQERRLASLWERARDLSRAANQWNLTAARAVAERDWHTAVEAQEGLARVLWHHPKRAEPPLLVTRQQLWARAACEALALGDVTRARRAVDEGLEVVPNGAPTDVELLVARARVFDAQGRHDDAREALGDALAVKSTPVRAAVLAELATATEQHRDIPKALDAWHQALAASEPFLPLAPWFGEVEFRARVEARIGALFVAQQQPTRARSWLVSAIDRYRAVGALRFAARVMSDLGALSLQLVALQDAEQWFSQAAATAEAGGDLLFQARQLVFLRDVLERRDDTRAKEVELQALGLAESLGWDEGARRLRR